MRSIVGLKRKNMLDIFQVIQLNGPISKPDITVKANVNAVTAHNFITELESVGIQRMN